MVVFHSIRLLQAKEASVALWRRSASSLSGAEHSLALKAMHVGHGDIRCDAQKAKADFAGQK